MPGSVSSASPTTVMPWSLCRAFGHSREYAVLENEYKNGESQRGHITTTSRKSWRTTRRLTPTLLDTFRDFYEDCNGSQVPFYFYDPWDTSPKFSYDADGSEVTGRYVVRFAGAWEQMVGTGRADVQIDLIEVA